MKSVILAGGMGTRLREETEFKPKPLVAIGDRPIMWHIMNSYANHSIKEFIVCVGYKGDMIRQYFRNLEVLHLDFTVTFGESHSLVEHGSLKESGWKVTVAETGSDTMTGGRIFKVRDHVGDETFMCTYGDGVSNVNITKLLEFHKKHGKIATLTAVNPPSRFGVLEISDDFQINNFKEKTQTHDWINGGFFVFQPEIFNYLDDNSILEREPLENLAQDNQLMAFKHEGFWQPMDTLREVSYLNDLWNSGGAPWQI